MYLSSVVGQGGIEAHVVLASKYEGIELWTIETKAPKFLDAECLTGDTLLHFERQALPNQQCLATMSIKEFHDKWVNGIDKVSKCDRTFKSKYKTILKQMRLRCFDFESGLYTTTSIKDIWESGKKAIYCITCDNVDIKASGNHYFLTQKGWVQAKDLIVSADSLLRISHKGRSPTPKNYLSFNRAIKEEVLERQDYTCYDCNRTINKACDIHHVIPVTRAPELAFDKANVVALCTECHYKRHIELGSTSLYPTLYAIDSIKYIGEEITYDLQVEHQDSNFVANGFVVHNCEKHRMLSSNSSSSRAIPFSRLVEEATFLPFDIRANGKGMQNVQSISEEERNSFSCDIIQLRDDAIGLMELHEPFVHKQHINRYMEPWSWQKKIVTGTEWSNFFHLRLAEGAQPEIQELARCMKAAMEQITPKELNPGDWHLPYVTEKLDEDTALKCSVARCARVSYMTHDNVAPSAEKDIDLYNMLLESEHMSPFEHQAVPMDVQQLNSASWNYTRAFWEPGITHMDFSGRFWSGNFRGFIQYRQLVDTWN